MKVRLLNNGGFGHGDKVKFPVVVDAVRDYSNRNVYNVDIDELVRVGFNSSIRVGDDGKPFPFMADFDECELVDDMTPTQTDMERITEVEASERRYSIRNMCCNQFGGRDEMQSIINSLQADVIVRGARIRTLEDALRVTNDELQGAIENINNTLKSNICSTDLDDPDYWDFQTCHDNAMLLRGVGDE